MNLQIEVPDDGSRQASSSPYSGKAKIVTDCSLGDMYDPFVDSFEPVSVKLDCVQEHDDVPKVSISSNRPINMEENNQACVQEHEDVPKASISSNRQLNMEDNSQALSESDMTARVSVSSNKPTDVEENTLGNGIGVVVSGDDDEFGGNADHGKEENSHETVTPNDVHEGDDDNTRKKSREISKEKDSSRSTKLFKVVLTKFVKDLLKPSWRQGNMSKEAFKTIVKRAVEKVSNSMEGHRIPKSRAKIDRYIDTSRHKLTKLVMGYVDKYVKA